MTYFMVCWFHIHPIYTCRWDYSGSDNQTTEYLTSSERYSIYIQDKEHVPKYLKSGWDNWATENDCHWKNMEILVETKNIVFCSVNSAPTLFQNVRKRSLTCKQHGILQICDPVRRSLLWPDNNIKPESEKTILKSDRTEIYWFWQV